MHKPSKISKSPKKKPADESPLPDLVQEPAAVYEVLKKSTHATVYRYKQFNMLAAGLPLSLKQWAGIVHLSDRTLQRYAKENKAFEGIYADRLFQVEKVLNEATKVFKHPVDFYNWLQQKNRVFDEVLSIASLQTQDGIQMLLDELGRMQQGIYI